MILFTYSSFCIIFLIIYPSSVAISRAVSIHFFDLATGSSDMFMIEAAYGE